MKNTQSAQTLPNGMLAIHTSGGANVSVFEPPSQGVIAMASSVAKSLQGSALGLSPKMPERMRSDENLIMLWGEEGRWREAVVQGDWALALEISQSEGFDADVMSERRGLGYSEPGWGERRWFGLCEDAGACAAMVDLLAARPGAAKHADGSPMDAPGSAALGAALATGNEVALAVLRAKKPELFAGSRAGVALTEAIGQLIGDPAWEEAQTAPKLLERLRTMERWVPGHSADKMIAAWADPLIARSLIEAENGRAACLRLALDAGLDPMAMTEQSHAKAPLALFALNLPSPSVFMEFLRAGVDPEALRMVRSELPPHAAAPFGVFGAIWSAFVWPPEAREEAPPDAKETSFASMRAQHQWADVRGDMSAKTLLDAAVAAPIAAFHKRDEIRQRQTRWRAAWEAWQLGQAAQGAQARISETRATDEPASWRGPRI
jgi:hypothetical protein